jgi:hypothetical protein
MRLSHGALALAVLLAAGSAGAFERFEGAIRPIMLKLAAHVGAPRPNEIVVNDLTLRRGDRTIRLQVREAWVLSGDALAQEVLDDAEPYDPNFTLAGPPEVVRRLETASPDEDLEVIAYVRRGSRLMTLSTVEPAKKKGD